MSAFLVSVSMSAPSAGYIAIPIDAVVWHSWPLSCSGWLSTDSSSPATLLDLAPFGSFFQNDHELVAAEPRHHVARTQRAPQPAADLHQQHVAGVVAQRIVDDLEPVEIDEQQRKPPLVALGGIDRLPQHAVEHLAVGQVGQAVVRRQIFDAFVRPGLFVGAVEILQRKRHIVGEALQQFGKFGNERVLLGRHVDHDADGLAADQQREGRARLGAIGTDDGMEGGDALIGDIVVGDTGAAWFERPFR